MSRAVFGEVRDREMDGLKVVHIGQPGGEYHIYHRQDLWEGSKNLFTNSGLCYVEAITRGVIMSHYYPSDISREQFARVLPTLLTARRRTKPRIVDLYDVFRGVLYVLKSGCQWRMLPADLPQWQTCYKYFRQLPAMERAAQLGATFHSGASLKKSVGAVRQSNGRKERTSFCIVDARSVKNTDSAENKGYDAGKKVSGIKRHIAVDTQGLPHAIHVTTANVTDRAGALAMFDHHQADMGQVQKVLVDGGYTGKPHWEGLCQGRAAVVGRHRRGRAPR